MNDEEIKDLIEDLDTIGHSQRIQMSVSLGINSNEFMLTNVSAFFSSRKKEFEDNGVELMWISSIANSSSGGSSGHTLLLTGVPWKVRIASRMFSSGLGLIQKQPQLISKRELNK